MIGTVFLVDDDVSTRKALGRLLQAKCFATKSFGSAEECRTALDTVYGPTCVVADLILPGINGHELLTRLPPHVPFIMLTGHADVKQTVETMMAGAVDLLEKPVDEHRLVMAVRSALELAVQRGIERDVKAALDTKMQRFVDLHGKRTQHLHRKLTHPGFMLRLEAVFAWRTVSPFWVEWCCA